MRKSNIITFLFLVAWILAAVGLICLRRVTFGQEKGYALVGRLSIGIDSLMPEFPETGNTSSEITPGEEVPAPAEEVVQYDREALFIGDSRTVGLWEYAGMEGTDFFATIGMNVFDVGTVTASVQDVGDVTLEDLLGRRTYHKIHIMMGINELGYQLEQILQEYERLAVFVREKQPNAEVFIEANLHVTQSRSESDPVINNGTINQLNGGLMELAGRLGIFYLDANPVFDDANGNLDTEKSHDNAHLYAKYYEEWGQWINQQMDALIQGEVKE